MQVKPYVLPHEQKAHKGHNKPQVAQGTTVYGVEHNGYWFSYAYLEQAAAEKIARKFSELLPHKDEMRKLMGFNFHEKPSVVSGRAPTEISA